MCCHKFFKEAQRLLVRKIIFILTSDVTSKKEFICSGSEGAEVRPLRFSSISLMVFMTVYDNYIKKRLFFSFRVILNYLKLSGFNGKLQISVIKG